jgi:hypothetical protein
MTAQISRKSKRQQKELSVNLGPTNAAKYKTRATAGDDLIACCLREHQAITRPQVKHSGKEKRRGIDSL